MFKPYFSLVAALICAALPAWAVPVSVAVVGPDNQPLPGATLSVLEGKYPVDPQLAPREVSGADGRFGIDWEGEFPAPGVVVAPEKRRYISVRVGAPGMATETRTLSEADTTIHLQKGRSWGGMVLDAEEKPVAGARVVLSRWYLAGQQYPVPTAPGERAPERHGFDSYQDIWKVSAITDEAGRWQIDGLPQQGRASVALDDARWVKKTFELTIGPNDAPPLFARPGATITGVLVAPDGTPIEGAPVSSGSYGFSTGEGGSAVTDAAGHFSLTGVEPGEISLISSSIGRAKTDADYLVPSLPKVRAVAGETTDIGQWKAVEALLVKGTIVDEQTKKPVEGARLNFWSGGAMFSSDEAGGVSGRILPELLRNMGGTLGSVYASGYVSTQIGSPVVDKESQTLDLGTIELARGTVLRGTVRVEGEDNKPIASPPYLTLSKGNDSAGISLWRGKPDFTTQALKPGTYTVKLERNGSPKNGDWEVVSPQTVTVPAPPPLGKPGKDTGRDTDKAAPVEIVLRRLTPAPPLLGVVRGRVTDAAGQALGGALVSVRLRAGNSYTEATVLSESDGSFEVERSEPSSSLYFAADSVEVKSIERPGYLWASQPVVETKDGATTVGGLTLKKRGAVFAGRVTDDAGEPAAGAWVAVLEARDYPPVQAKPDGTFEMKDLPIEKFTLIGARGSSFGRGATNANKTNFALRLQTPAASDRAALAERALEGKVEWWNAQNYWDVLGTARMAELLARGDEKQARDWGAQQFAFQLAQRDPSEFLRRAPALLEMADTGGKAALEAKVFELRAASENADDRIAANDWLDAQKMVKREIKAQSVTQLLQMALVAHALGREDAAGWLDYGAAIAAQIKGAGGQGNTWGATVAQIGAEALTPFVEGMKPTAEFAFWQSASMALAKNGDMAGARRALSRMEELGQTPEMVEQGKKQEWNSAASQLENTRQSVAMALAETDAAGALQMAPTAGNDWNRVNALLVIADRAIAAKDAATAEKALRQVMQMQNGNAEKFALAASLAQRLEPKLGAELWADALQRVAPDKNDFGGYRPSVGMWAFYHARLDAGQSRVLIEREWSWRLPAAVKTKGEEYSSDGQMLGQLEIGMAAIDPARALEMLAEARAQTGKPDATPTANVGLAAAITANDEQRARWGVDARY